MFAFFITCLTNITSSLFLSNRLFQYIGLIYLFTNFSCSSLKLVNASKPLQVVEPVAVDALTSVVSFELPPAKAGVKLVSPDNVAELVRLLHEEAKAI